MATTNSSNSSNKREDRSGVLKRQGVNHTYHDYSMVSAADASLLFAKSQGGGHVRQHNPMASSSQQQGFAVKLHYMLSAVEASGDSSIVSWQPHGRCFVVHDRKAFVERVLSNYFLQSNFASFQRQLNLYGFKRLSSSQDRGGYYHELFLRGRPELSCFIQRIKRKGTGPRKPDSPDSEPDFYAMPFLPVSSVDRQPQQTPSFPQQIGMGQQVPNKPDAAMTSFALKNILPSSLSTSPAPAPTSNPNAMPPLPYYVLQDPSVNPPPRQDAQYTPQTGSSTNERDSFTRQILQPTPIGPSARVLAPATGSNHHHQQQWASPLQTPSSYGVVMPYGMVSNGSGREHFMNHQVMSTGGGALMNTAYGMVSVSSSSPPMASSQHLSSYNGSIDTTLPSTNQSSATNSESQARKDSGAATPNSWQNAFGEEEDFWVKMG